MKSSFLKGEAEVKCDSLDLHSERDRSDGIVPENLVFIYFQLEASCLWLI
jgi:hypothetical protein